MHQSSDGRSAVEAPESALHLTPADRRYLQQAVYEAVCCVDELDEIGVIAALDADLARRGCQGDGTTWGIMQRLQAYLTAIAQLSLGRPLRVGERVMLDDLIAVADEHDDMMESVATVRC
ncbi:MAG: hypothetical protein HY000_21905 [Planctomycetes bacterium]|nr:hypothetical protein [Planctomycetota bacterium]